MGAAPAALDELDGARVLHALGALAVDLQDLVSHLRTTREGGREGGRRVRTEEVKGRRRGGMRRKENNEEQEEDKKKDEEEEGKQENEEAKVKNEGVHG